VVYKGELIASGEAKAVRSSLEDVWGLKGTKLIDALENKLVLQRIDDAIEKLGIKITIPKNSFNAIQSQRKLERILISLKNRKPPKIFDPKKEALKNLGIKLKTTKNGLCVDFAGTKYLYPIKESENNIVKIKLTGNRKYDKILAYELAGVKPNKNYTWHHLDDFDPTTNTCTMQLVEKKIHEATYPHFGSVKLIEDFFNIIYK
jgi:hypothetical protein